METMKLTPNQRVTLILINDMGICIRREVEILEYLEGPTRKIKYRKKGSKGTYTSLVHDETLVFEGWNLPLRVDTDTETTFLGNGCHNFTEPADYALLHHVRFDNLNDRFNNNEMVLYRGQHLFEPEEW